MWKFFLWKINKLRRYISWMCPYPRSTASAWSERFGAASSWREHGASKGSCDPPSPQTCMLRAYTYTSTQLPGPSDWLAGLLPPMCTSHSSSHPLLKHSCSAVPKATCTEAYFSRPSPDCPCFAHTTFPPLTSCRLPPLCPPSSLRAPWWDRRVKG